MLPTFARAAFSMPGSPLKPEPARARRLFAGGRASIYAEPTRQGSVCYLFVGGRGSSGSCVSDLLDGRYLRLPRNVLAPTQIVVLERDGVLHIYDVRRCSVADVNPLSGLSPLGPSPG